MSLEATIKISPEARDALKALGRKGESYDAIIRRLLADYKKLDEAYEEIGFLEALLHDTEAERR